MYDGTALFVCFQFFFSNFHSFLSLRFRFSFFFQIFFLSFPFLLSKPHRDSCGTQVVIISLLSDAILDFYWREHPTYAALNFEEEIGNPTLSILLEPNSLLILSGSAFFGDCFLIISSH